MKKHEAIVQRVAQFVEFQVSEGKMTAEDARELAAAIASCNVSVEKIEWRIKAALRERLAKGPANSADRS